MKGYSYWVCRVVHDLTSNPWEPALAYAYGISPGRGLLTVSEAPGAFRCFLGGLENFYVS